MGYIRDLEAEVRNALDDGADKETVIKLFKERVWESYKNGQKSMKSSTKQSSASKKAEN